MLLFFEASTCFNASVGPPSFKMFQCHPALQALVNSFSHGHAATQLLRLSLCLNGWPDVSMADLASMEGGGPWSGRPRGGFVQLGPHHPRSRNQREQGARGKRIWTLRLLRKWISRTSTHRFLDHFGPLIAHGSRSGFLDLPPWDLFGMPFACTWKADWERHDAMQLGLQELQIFWGWQSLTAESKMVETSVETASNRCERRGNRIFLTKDSWIFLMLFISVSDGNSRSGKGRQELCGTVAGNPRCYPPAWSERALPCLGCQGQMFAHWFGWLWIKIYFTPYRPQVLLLILRLAENYGVLGVGL